MDTDKLQRFQETVSTMGPRIFPVICGEYLREKGYTVHTGPPNRWDMSHDLGGKNPDGADFIGHCTTMTGDASDKFKDDVERGVRARAYLKLPPATEMLCFSAKLREPLPNNETLVSKLIDAALCNDDRYQVCPLKITIVTGYEIAEHALLHPGDTVHRTIANMAGLLPYPQEHELVLDQEEYWNPRLVSQFQKDIHNYSADAPEFYSKLALRRILANAWDAVNCNPELAWEILKDESKHIGPINGLIVPICKLALNEQLNAAELCEFLEYAWAPISIIPDDMSALVKILVVQVIKKLVYNNAEVLQSEGVILRLSNLASSATGFWLLPLSDLYFRAIVGHVNVSPDLERILQHAWALYSQEQSNSESPLVRLSDILLYPVEIAKQYSYKDLRATVFSVAKNCRNSTECTWCLYALLRMLPLYTDAQMQCDYNIDITNLINLFNDKVLGKTPQIFFLQLTGYLRTFVQKGDILQLIAYEQKFRKVLELLSPHQICILQMEYASCLYLALHHFEPSGLSSVNGITAFLNSLDPLNTVYFNNPLFARNIGLRKSLVASSIKDKKPSRKTIIDWLKGYVRVLYEYHAKILIDKKHLWALRFWATAQIYDFYQGFGDLFLNHLKKTNISAISAANCAHCASGFKLFYRNNNTALMLSYLTKALNADDYVIWQHALPIAYGLYCCRHYGITSTSPEISILAQRFANVTQIGSHMPRLHWIWYAGIIPEILDKEKEFLFDLANKMTRHMPVDYVDCAITTNPTSTITYSSHIVDAIKKCAKESIFAQVLLSEMNNPEVWNAIGTIIHDTERLANESLRASALFYSVAAFFSRSFAVSEQKYFYNFIHCKSWSYLLDGSKPDSTYLLQVASYLSTPAAGLFGWYSRVEQTKSYFDLLAREWDSLSDYVKEEIENKFENLGRTEWAYKELRVRISNNAVLCDNSSIASALATIE